MPDRVVQRLDPNPSEIEVLVSGGGIDTAARDHAVRKIRTALGEAGRPVLFAMLRLTTATDPANERPADIRLTVDLDGQPIRTHVRARTMDEAVDQLEQRLRDKLSHLHSQQRHLRRRGPGGGGGEWHHGDLPTPRLPYFDRDADDRVVVTQRTFGADLTVDEAVFDLEMLDHDFYLFHDIAAGADALVHRTDPGSYEVVHVNGGPSERPSTAVPVTYAATRAAPLTVTEGLGRLDAGNEPWVFFREVTTGRGHVVYRRYDGHYGVVVPADGTSADR